MKKIFLIILFLLPISICSFVVKYKTIFLPEEENYTSVSVYVKDKDLTLDLEDYILGVVAGEMPALFEEEALKAQAIAARSFAMSKMQNNTISINSNTSDQVFLTNEDMQMKWGNDYQTYYTKIANCVKATKNMVLKRDNQVLRTYYFAMSNGYTEDSQTVFNEISFQSTESKWDNETLKNFTVSKEFTKLDIQKALSLNGESLIIGKIIRNNTHHVEKITINGQEFTGIEFRQKLALRSTDFTIQENDNKYNITTKGNGHGVGMSQYGANGMAKDGYNYTQILKHYYGEVEIKNI